MKYQGKSNVPLNEKGLDQARNTAYRLSSSFSPEVIFSSPMKRALVTAQIINDHNKKPISIEELDDLSEIDFGDWEGRTLHELKENDNDRYSRWRKDPLGVVPPGGESFEDICSRVSRSLSHILASQKTRILVVSHGGIIRVAAKILLGIDPSLIWKLRLDNCSISIFDIWNDTSTLVTWNDHIHNEIPPSLVASIPLSV